LPIELTGLVIAQTAYKPNMMQHNNPFDQERTYLPSICPTIDCFWRFIDNELLCNGVKPITIQCAIIPRPYSYRAKTMCGIKYARGIIATHFKKQSFLVPVPGAFNKLS